MLNKLKSMFSKSAPAAPSQKPVPPFEVLVPEERPPAEQPQMAAKVLSCIFGAIDDVTTLSFEGRSATSSNAELRQFLTLIGGAKKIDTLVTHCKSIMFQSDEQGALGSLCCTDRSEKLHCFTVFQFSPPPNLKWEIRRKVLVAQQGAQADGPGSGGSAT